LPRRFGARLVPAIADDGAERFVLADQPRQFRQRIAQRVTRRIARRLVAPGRQTARTRRSV
jgi:hypothetical protein